MKTLTRMFSLVAVSGMLLSACTTVPVQLQGDYGNLSPESAGAKNIGARVRWGGVVLETRPEADHTCFEILSRALGSSMRPVESDEASGRFIACKGGFYDPEVFVKGREVTITGTLVRIDRRKVGDYNYTYPVVNTDFISLWPKRREVIYRDIYTPFSPYYWYYPYPYYYRYPF